MSERRALIAALAEAHLDDTGDRRGDTGHPEVEELLAYLGDELTPTAETRVRGHLLTCRACTATLLDLDTLRAAEAPADGVRDLEVHAAHRDLLGRMAPAPRAAPRRFVGALAATLLLTAAGLSLWVVHLRSTIAELTAPVANPQAVHFDLGTRAGGAEELRLAPGQRRFAIAIAPRADQRFDTYSVAIEALDEPRSAILVPGLVRRAGIVRLEVSTLEIPPGAYRLTLSGTEGASAEALATLELAVRPP